MNFVLAQHEPTAFRLQPLVDFGQLSGLNVG
jgi:hypothetical protein